MDIFWELSQQKRIGTANARATRAENASTRAESDIEQLGRRVDRLALGCQALWELLRDRANLGDEDLLQKMEDIDLRDGVADGKIGKMVLECPSCARRVSSTRTTCLYCGADVSGVRAHLFE